MRPRFLGTKHYPRIVGGTSATQRFRTARGRVRSGGHSLIRIDLASLVSKYIGQTERNLDRVLNEALQLQAVLYFDEADELFDREADDSDVAARFAAAKHYLRAGARRRRLLLMTGKPRPETRRA